jgi:hypothetical protein
MSLTSMEASSSELPLCAGWLALLGDKWLFGLAGAWMRHWLTFSQGCSCLRCSLGDCRPSMAYEVLVASCCAQACSFGDGGGKRKCGVRLGGTLPFGDVGGFRCRDVTSAAGCPSTAVATFLVRGQEDVQRLSWWNSALRWCLRLSVSRHDLGSGMPFDNGCDAPSSFKV